MCIESSINKVSNIRVLIIFLIIAKIECWPVSKQDPFLVPKCHGTSQMVLYATLRKLLAKASALMRGVLCQTERLLLDERKV